MAIPTITYGQIREKHPEPFTMEMVGDEADAIIDAVNQGIDAHLEACFCRERGDRFNISGGRLYCMVSAESLPVLVRRLTETDNEHAESVASGILSCIGFSEQDMGYGLYQVIKN